MGGCAVVAYLALEAKLQRDKALMTSYFTN